MKSTSQCRHCKEVKPIEQFKKQDKHLCLVCVSRTGKEWRANNQDKVRAKKKKQNARDKERRQAGMQLRRQKREYQAAQKLLIYRLKKVLIQKRIVENNEYVYITINRKTKPLHRHVMELHIGRELRWGEEVHHINGKRYDCRIENLELFERAKHRELHVIQRRCDDAFLPI